MHAMFLSLTLLKNPGFFFSSLKREQWFSTDFIEVERATLRFIIRLMYSQIRKKAVPKTRQISRIDTTVTGRESSVGSPPLIIRRLSNNNNKDIH